MNTKATGDFSYQFEIIEKESLADGFLPLTGYRLRHQLFSGGWSAELDRECLERGAAVAVLLYDPLPDQLVMVEQFRVGTINTLAQPWLLEIVAGLAEPGEDKAVVARREVVEEAGCQVLQLEPICEYFSSPGCTSEQVVLYCGRVNSQGVGGIHGLADEGEDIRVQPMSRKRVWQLFQQGRIINAPTIIALQWLQLNYRRLQQQWR